jgi:hypothetical protein
MPISIQKCLSPAVDGLLNRTAPTRTDGLHPFCTNRRLLSKGGQSRRASREMPPHARGARAVHILRPSAIGQTCNERHKMHFVQTRKYISCTTFHQKNQFRENETHFMYFISRKTPAQDIIPQMKVMKCTSLSRIQPNTRNAVHKMHYVQTTKYISCTTFHQKNQFRENDVHFVYFISRKTPAQDIIPQMKVMKCC